jgi:hypothetical protein
VLRAGGGGGWGGGGGGGGGGLPVCSPNHVFTLVIIEHLQHMTQLNPAN